MNTVNRLIEYYKYSPPFISYGGLEGEAVSKRLYVNYPEKEATECLGARVWYYQEEGISNNLIFSGYCVLDVCLDTFGQSTPMSLPILREMEGHKFDVLVYVSMYDSIKMRVIGGFTESSAIRIN